MLVDTEIKYRPTKIADLIFPNKEVEEVIKAYGTGQVTRPLILCGKNGTGKSLLAELLPDAIEGFRASVNRIRATDLNSNKEVYAQFTRNKQFDALFTLNGQRYNYNIIEEVNVVSHYFLNVSNLVGSILCVVNIELARGWLRIVSLT